MLSMNGGGHTAAEERRVQANHLLKQGKYYEARELLTKTINETLASTLAGGREILHMLYAHRSKAHIQLGYAYLALYDILECTRIRSDWIKGWVILAKTFFELKYYQNAYFALEAALKMAPEDEQLNRLEEPLKHLHEQKMRDCEDERVKEQEFLDRYCDYNFSADFLPPRSLHKEPIACFSALTADCLVEVRPSSIEKAGRGMFAKEDIKAGTIFFQESPLVMASEEEGRCAWCFSPLSQLLHPLYCFYCNDEKYCNITCRDAAWSCYHKELCGTPYFEALRAGHEVKEENGEEDGEEEKEEEVISSLHGGTLRLLFARCVGMALCADEWPCSTHQLPEFQLLHSFIDNLSSENVESKRAGLQRTIYDIDTHLQQLQMIRELLGIQHLPQFDFEWYLHMYFILKVNSFGIVPKNSTIPAAVGVFLLGSMANHSCEPNTSYSNVDNTNTMVFISRRDIKKDEEITISYLDSEAGKSPKIKRQLLLRNQYGFECKCNKCCTQL